MNTYYERWGRVEVTAKILKRRTVLDFKALFSTLLHLPPLRFHCVGLNPGLQS
jgi:hypothetical protein